MFNNSLYPQICTFIEVLILKGLDVTLWVVQVPTMIQWITVLWMWRMACLVRSTMKWQKIEVHTVWNESFFMHSFALMSQLSSTIDWCADQRWTIRTENNILDDVFQFNRVQKKVDLHLAHYTELLTCQNDTESLIQLSFVSQSNRQTILLGMNMQTLDISSWQACHSPIQRETVESSSSHTYHVCLHDHICWRILVLSSYYVLGLCMNSRG